MVTLGVFSLLSSLCFVLNSTRSRQLVSPAENLALAILEYGHKLHSEGRDSALVSLRNSFSLSLHILGFHKIRVQLGEFAIRSASVINDSLAKSEILIDDLGWANYLLNNRKVARENIKRGVNIASKSKKRNTTNYLKLSLSEAKGLRHMSIIDYNHEEVSARALSCALSILSSLEDQSTEEVQREIAQIHHARALIAAMRLGVHKSGSIRKNDIEGVDAINRALEDAKKASSIFKGIGDMDRYVKALFMEVRLLEAKGANADAREVSAIRDRTLAASQWATTEGTDTITGK